MRSVSKRTCKGARTERGLLVGVFGSCGQKGDGIGGNRGEDEREGMYALWYPLP